jgi:hypothetical protein
MSNQIKLHDATGGVFYVVYSDQISLQFNGTTASYTPPGSSLTPISLVEALFSEDVFTLTLENSSSYPVNEIRVRTPPNGDEVVSYMQWSISGNHLVLEFQVPAKVGQEMTWEFGDGAPPIKLKVKLKRNA